MKYNTKTWITVIALIFISCCTVAQDASANATPRWVSDKGYWVVETNLHSPLEHIIRFYNNDDVMIYQETVHGVRLNTNRIKIKMRLKKALESAITAWNMNKIPKENKHYVSAILK